MPKPKFLVKPPIKPKRATVKRDKDTGAIVRDSSNRRKPLEDESCQSVNVSDNNHDREPQLNTLSKRKINENVNKKSLNTTLKNTAGVKKAHQLV